MKEFEIDCLKSENERLKEQNKELKEKQKTPLIKITTSTNYKNKN